MIPSAKKFLVRSTCLVVMSRPSSARALSVLMGISKRRVLLERAVGERVGRVAGLGQVLRREGVLVDDQRAAGRQVPDVRLERGRVHGHQHVRLVARRVDLLGREADLEAADAGQGAGRGADLGGIVRQGADVVAEDGGGAGELRAGELHAVAGVAAEADGDALEFLDWALVSRDGFGCHRAGGSLGSIEDERKSRWTANRPHGTGPGFYA